MLMFHGSAAVRTVLLAHRSPSVQSSEVYCFSAEWNVTVLTLFVFCMLPKKFCAFAADIHNLLEPNTHFAVIWIMLFVMDSVFVL
jgi:hypothetical protein